MAGTNYEFLNELMDDPNLAAILRAGGSPVMNSIAAQQGPPPQPSSWSPDQPPATAADLQYPTPPAPDPSEGGTSRIDDIVARAGRPELPPERPMPVGGFAPRPMTFGQRLKAALPRILEAGIAAGATPSQYGGGALDIFRGMQVGRDALQQRDMLTYNVARQRGQDELNRRKTEADIAHSNAGARYYDAESKWREAQAAQRSEVNPQRDLYERFMSEPDPAKKEQLKNLWLQSMGHAPPPDPRSFVIKDGVMLNTRTGEQTIIDPDAKRQADQRARINEIVAAHQFDAVAPNGRKIFNDPKVMGSGPANTWAAMQRATPEEMHYIATGQRAAPKQPGNMNPTELYYQATLPGEEGKRARAAVDLMQRPQLTTQDRHDAQVRKANLGKANSEYQHALTTAEQKYNAAKAKIDAPGVRPGTKNAKGVESRMTWDDYNQQNRTLVDELVNAKNAAHRAHEAAMAENDPEHYVAHPGYDANAMPIPMPGQITDSSGKNYMDSRFPGRR